MTVGSTGEACRRQSECSCDSRESEDLRFGQSGENKALAIDWEGGYLGRLEGTVKAGEAFFGRLLRCKPELWVGCRLGGNRNVMLLLREQRAAI